MSSKTFESFFGGVDFSRGTEDFAEGLLSQALSVLNTDEEVSYISDDELDMLAAAGNVFQNMDFDEE